MLAECLNKVYFKQNLLHLIKYGLNFTLLYLSTYKNKNESKKD